MPLIQFLPYQLSPIASSTNTTQALAAKQEQSFNEPDKKAKTFQDFLNEEEGI
jgi:hypothetical protein